ncbi:MAG: alpha/beta hydrolase [Opitutaceae bacterium]
MQTPSPTPRVLRRVLSGPLAALLVLALALTGRGAEVKVLSGLAYKEGPGIDAYEKERCQLDLYLPAGTKNFPTLVWFHGGGLKNGNRDEKNTVAEVRSLAAAGVAVASASYRLSPKVNFPAYLQDAAAAFAWTKRQIASHGGDATRVFIGGHSAGGYLALMVGLDPRYLREAGLDLSALAGVIPFSGQTMDHYTVREERKIGRYSVTAGEAAPVFFARKDTPPLLVLYADHDMVARQAENEYFVEIMKGAGNPRITGRLIRDRTHGTIASKMAEDGDPAREAVLAFIANPAAMMATQQTK